jgi:hypothetical protein
MVHESVNGLSACPITQMVLGEHHRHTRHKEGERRGEQEEKRKDREGRREHRGTPRERWGGANKWREIIGELCLKTCL